MPAETEGYPQVRFDPERRQNYVEVSGERQYHAVPEGFEFDSTGQLHRKRRMMLRTDLWYAGPDGQAVMARKGATFSRGDLPDVWERLVEIGTLAPLPGEDGEPEAPGRWPLRVVPPPAGAGRRLSVIIPCYGKWALTEGCLRSLAEHGPEAEVVVVDNGSADETPERLAQWPGIHVIRFGTNQGVAGALNAGLRAATGDILCVLNNDTIVQPGGMQRLAQAAYEVGIAALALGMHKPDFTFKGYTEDPSQPTYPDGCCLAARRDVWERVGEFETTWGTYAEDADWGYRAWSLGFGWVCVPGCVHHLGNQTNRDLPGMREALQKAEAALRQRWQGKGLGERILVRRWGAAGDAIMAGHAVAALRRQLPLARIYYQTAPQTAALLRGVPWADAVGYDDPEGGYTRRVSLDGAYESLQAEGRWVHPAAACAERLGVVAGAEPYCVPEPEELRGWAAGLLPDGPLYVAMGLRSRNRSVVNWREGGWAELARAMPECVFVALDGEAHPNVNARPGHPAASLWQAPNVRDLTGQTPSLRHLHALLRRCQAAVSVDTGILHLANAAGLPVVALVAASPAAARAPLGGDCAVIAGKAPCLPCRNPKTCNRTDGPHCLEGVTGEQVAEALQGLLRQPKGQELPVVLDGKAARALRKLAEERGQAPGEVVLALLQQSKPRRGKCSTSRVA